MQLILHALVAIGVLALWIGVGSIGTHLSGMYASGGSSKEGSRRGALMGPVYLAAMVLDIYIDPMPLEQKLWVTREDRKNPFRNELQDALLLRRGLQWVPGEEAARERQDLEAVIRELREWPSKLEEHDGDRFVAAMRTEYETVKAASKTRLEAFDEIERKVTEEVRQELEH